MGYPNPDHEPTTLRRVSISRVIDRVGQVLGGRYRLLAPIGTGASATVYLADDVVLRRRVAVKVLHDALADDASFLKRFRAEAHAAAALNHPHIMAVHDWGQGDVPYLVTELLVGGSLRGLLDTGHRLELPQARQVALEAARALDYAHRRGFVHRDVKPANLLFDEEGRLRVADFGLARALAEAAWTEPAGAILGTARYASPEQAQGSSLDGRSDVYSLGLVIIEAVSGSVPFAADTTLGTLMARVDRPVPVPEELGPLVPALSAAGRADPAERPDAATFVTMLMAAGELGPVAPLPLAGTDSLDDVDLDLREPTTLYVAERQVRAEFEPEIMTAPPGTTTNGLTIVTEGESQPRTTVVDRGGAEAVPPGRRDKRRERKAAAAAIAAGGVLVGGGTATDAAALSGRPDPDADLDVPFEVMATDSAPKRRRRWPIVAALVALLVVLAAGGAAALIVANQTPTHVLTNYVDTDIAEARASLEADGFVVVTDIQFSELPSGQVLAQDPGDGTSLKEGETVNLAVSQGPPPVVVPTELGGHGLDEVTQILADAKLGVEVVEQPYDESWDAGVVLGIAEGTPAELPRDSKVPLIVSAGPKPRTIPDGLTGGTEAAVTQQLTALGLKVERNEAYSDVVDAGNVIQVNPKPGSQVARDSTVTVQVSLGEEPVLIPPGIVGMSVAEASAALEARGLTVSGVSGNPGKPVTGADPGVGSSVKRGSGVTLITK